MPNEGEIMVNAEFDFPFAGKTYHIRRANIRQVIDWQRKVVEITSTKDAAGDLLMLVHAIYLVLKSADPAIDENYVLDNTPGDTDVMQTLQVLGFTSQQKVAMLLKIKDSLANPSNGDKSSIS